MTAQEMREASFNRGYDATGIKTWYCVSCGSFEHEPLVMKKAGYYGGDIYRFVDSYGEYFPAGHESGLLWETRNTSGCAERPRPEKTPPMLRVPVPLAFDPIESLKEKDGKQHEGVHFREVWTDPLARTLWLGIKPFTLTSQYFRRAMLAEADRLRNWPERLLSEHVHISTGDWWSPTCNLFDQLAPYLIGVLQDEGTWPYLRMPTPRMTWKVEAKKAA